MSSGEYQEIVDFSNQHLSLRAAVAEKRSADMSRIKNSIELR